MDERLRGILQRYSDVVRLVCHGTDLPSALSDLGIPSWKFKAHVRPIAEGILVDSASFFLGIQKHRPNLDSFKFVAEKILKKPSSYSTLMDLSLTGRALAPV